MTKCAYIECKRKLKAYQLYVQSKCRCGFLFCDQHNPPEEHTCLFEYHELYKEELKKKNIKVVADKVDKI